MSDLERLVRFKLLGQEYSFYTGASEVELDTIFTLVKSLIEENIGGSKGTLPVSKVAILACLNIASQYVKMQQEFDSYKENAERRIGKLNDQISYRLLNE
ncbi:MAG: cell division protein ZapA [Desulfoprunum sp.]|nr:cell division protein ZapA [Desulfoprunum sp.]